MAQKTTVIMQCDLPHEDGIEPPQATDNIVFSIGPDDYEADACPAHSAQYRGALNELAAAGRPRAGEYRRPRRDKRSRPYRANSQEIRKWAKQNGVEVSELGRIPASVIEQYEQRDQKTPELAEAV